MLSAPLLLSVDGLLMILTNREFSKATFLSIEIMEEVDIWLLPIIYTFALYAFWRLNSINFDLFTTVVGASIFLVLLLTPAAVGWYVWLVPFLSFYQLRSDRFGYLFGWLYSGLFYITFSISHVEIDFLHSKKLS